MIIDRNIIKPRIKYIILRRPQRSPAKPNQGAINVPINRSAPKIVSKTTELVSDRIYQPKIVKKK